MAGVADGRTKLVEKIMEAQHRIHKAFHRHMKSRMEDLPVTLPKLGVLGMISQHPGLTVSELARQFMGAKSNISEMVERLGREGLLEKRPDAADQRLTRLHLTGDGQVILKELRARHLAFAQEALTGLSDEQLASVAASLDLLYDALDKNLATGGSD